MEYFASSTKNGGFVLVLVSKWMVVNIQMDAVHQAFGGV